MSGFHIHCGSWHGSDGSGNAFPEVIRDLLGLVSEEEEDTWMEDLMIPLREQEQAASDEDSVQIELSPTMMEVLIGPLRRYHAELAERLGFPDPQQATHRERESSGHGWRLACAHDLLQAYEICRQTAQPVIVFWS